MTLFPVVLPNVSSPFGESLVPHLISALRKNQETIRILQDKLDQTIRAESPGKGHRILVHELNNMLTVALGNAQIAKERCLPLSEAMPLLSEVEFALAKAADLLRQFKRRETPEKNDLSSFQRVKVNEILTKFSRLITRILPRNIFFRQHLQQGIPDIQADITQVYQVFLDLVINAREAMPIGGKIRLATCCRSFTSEAERFPSDLKPGTFVGFSVSDSGTGMTRDVSEAACQASFSTKPNGSGQGLYVVQSLMQNHHGFLMLESRPGKGTCATVFFPAWMSSQNGRGSRT